MPKWDYVCVNLVRSYGMNYRRNGIKMGEWKDLQVYEMLAIMGEEGYELATYDGQNYIFKRPKPVPQPPAGAGGPPGQRPAAPGQRPPAPQGARPPGPPGQMPPGQHAQVQHPPAQHSPAQHSPDLPPKRTQPITKPLPPRPGAKSPDDDS